MFILFHLPVTVLQCSVDDGSVKKRTVNLEDKGEHSAASIYAEKNIVHSVHAIDINSERVEPKTTTEHFRVAMLLSLGISSGQYFISVSKDRCPLELTVAWPSTQSDMKMMHHNRLSAKTIDQFELYHPALLCFGHHLKSHW